MPSDWSALHSGFRGNKYEGPNKEAAISKLKDMYKAEGMETPAEKCTEVEGQKEAKVEVEKTEEKHA